MFTADNRHKGLAHFRVVRAERREIAILAKEVAKSNPDKTEAECKQLAAEIREARKRTAEAKRTIKVQKRGRGHGHKNQSKRRRRKGSAFNTIPVQTVNTIKK